MSTHVKLSEEFLEHLKQRLRDPAWPRLNVIRLDNTSDHRLAREAVVLMLMTGQPHWVYWSTSRIELSDSTNAVFHAGFDGSIYEKVDS